MRASKLYPFSIPANGSVNLLVSGDYFKIKSATGSVTVTGDSFGSLAGMLPGQGLRDTDFTRLTLRDETGTINKGSILVSDGTFVDDRVTGIVDVVDGELDKSMSGKAFICALQIPNNLGLISCIELWNPIGSTKNIIVSDYNASCSVACVISLMRTTAQQNASLNAQNKLSGGPGSTAIYGSVASATAVGVTLEPWAVSANNQIFRTLKQPFIVKPGSGLTIANNTTANHVLLGGFQFTEEPI